MHSDHLQESRLAHNSRWHSLVFLQHWKENGASSRDQNMCFHHPHIILNNTIHSLVLRVAA